jgi:hypothetical protein
LDVEAVVGRSHELLEFIDDLVLKVEHDLGFVQTVRIAVGDAEFLLDFLHDAVDGVEADSGGFVVLVDERS